MQTHKWESIELQDQIPMIFWKPQCETKRITETEG